MALTPEQLAALQAVLQESQQTQQPQQTQPATQQTSEPEPLTFSWGGQQYTARDAGDLQRQLDELRRQEEAQQQAIAINARAEAARQAQEAQQAQQRQSEGSRFDKEEYATLFLKDPVAANDYLMQHSPVIRGALGALSARQVALEQQLAASEFMRTNDDYEGTPENYQKLTAIMQANNLPFTTAGLGMAFLVGKQNGAFQTPQATQQEQEEEVSGPRRGADGRFLPADTSGLSDEELADLQALQNQPVRRAAPPSVPKRRPSAAAQQQSYMDSFENLTAAQMKEALERIEQAGLTQ